jgi:tRNA (guanine-N7-)-methyltransferase
MVAGLRPLLSPRARFFWQKAVQFIPPDYFRKLEKPEVFPRQPRPLEIDLGCGDGSFPAAMAGHHPERDFLGIERLLGRARKAYRKACKADLENLKILRLEISYALDWLLPDSCASRIHLLFPDPWPKKKHHKRRLVTHDFCAAIRRVLEPGGEFLFKTDDEEYFEESMSVLVNEDSLQQLPWEEDAFFYPQTDFERRWLGQGKPIQSARFKAID